MARFVSFDDDNTLIAVDKIVMFFPPSGDKPGTEIVLSSGEHIIVAEEFDEVCKTLRRFK